MCWAFDFVFSVKVLVLSGCSSQGERGLIAKALIVVCRKRDLYTVFQAFKFVQTNEVAYWSVCNNLPPCDTDQLSFCLFGAQKGHLSKQISIFHPVY